MRKCYLVTTWHVLLCGKLIVSQNIGKTGRMETHETTSYIVCDDLPVFSLGRLYSTKRNTWNLKPIYT